MTACGGSGQNSDSETESNDSTQTTAEQEVIIEADLSSFKDAEYSALFELPSSDMTKLLEPACLSTYPTIRFDNLDNNQVSFICGQDAMTYTFVEAIEETGTFTFKFEDESLMKITQMEATDVNPFDHIALELDDFSKLYMGYYDDSITSINSQKILMVKYSEDNIEYLQENGRFGAIQCPEDMFD